MALYDSVYGSNPTLTKDQAARLAGAAGGLSAIFTGNAVGLSDGEVADNIFSGQRIGNNAARNNALGPLIRVGTMLLGKKAAKEGTKKVVKNQAAKEAAKKQFREETKGMKTKIIRNNPDRNGNNKIIGVYGKNTKGKKNPTYRPKSDGSYSVGKPGKVKHYRPSTDNKYGYTIDNKPPINK